MRENSLLGLFGISMAGALTTAFSTLCVVHYLHPSSRGAYGSGPLDDAVAVQLVLVGGGCAGVLTFCAAALLLRRVEILPTTIVVAVAARAAVGGTAPFLGWLSARPMLDRLAQQRSGEESGGVGVPRREPS